MRDGQRRWRKENDKLICDGDCTSREWGLCTCGLLHWASPYAERHDQIEDYWKKRCKHEEAFRRLVQ